MQFRRITDDDLDAISPYLNKINSKSCDYTIGGIFMWTDLFKYEYCIYDETLFIKGCAEGDFKHSAFSIPIGKLTAKETIPLLKEYCYENSIRLEFSGISEEYIDDFKDLNPQTIIEIRDWFDYIYDAQQLATLKGNKMSKKRNHVNKFSSLYPDAKIEEIDITNIQLVLDCLHEIDEQKSESSMATTERILSEKVLNTPNLYGFESLCVKLENKVIAFTLGEVKDDILFVHIEKALHDFQGATEFINKTFVESNMTKYKLNFVNREDDGGHEGLRNAKLSYYPVQILKKYNIIF